MQFVDAMRWCFRPSLLATILLLGIFSSTGSIAADGIETVVIDKVEGDDLSFEVEMAITPDERSLGLMHRDALDPMSGMLFIYPGPQDVNMWMHSTKIPLDMLFIGADGTIVKIKERAVPYSNEVINSGEPVVAVLELNGGSASRYGIRPGDRVQLPQIGQ
jgi:uncharacterized membrane protein (UPF0127 family)